MAKKINPLWSTEQILGKIVEITHPADNIVNLKIHCNQRMQFGKAGQHHPVTVEIDGRRYERSYSLTQLDQQHILLTLKKLKTASSALGFAIQPNSVMWSSLVYLMETCY